MLAKRLWAPEVSNSEALTTKLSGHASYKAWHKSLINHLISYSSEWEEYARTGDIDSVVLEFNLSPSTHSAAKNVLNHALLMLIKKTTTDAAHEFVIKFCKNAPGLVNAKQLLDALSAKYCRTGSKLPLLNKIISVVLIRKGSSK